MNQTDFLYLLQHTQSITHEKTEAVKSIIDEFPYFQSARAIYLKGLKDQDSFKYNQALKTTAAYTTDRSILFDFITSETFNQNEISRIIKQNTTNLNHIIVDAEDISINKKVTVDDTLQQQIKDTQGVLDPKLFKPKTEDKIVLLLSENKEKTSRAPHNTKPEDTLQLGKPLEFNKKESHSFNEWLKLTQLRPINRETENTQKKEQTIEAKKRSDKFKLIDKFISANPKINPSKNASNKENLATVGMIQPEALMTETLARIYVEQKNYKKAIKSYKILSLKYPEKSSFFANQIKAVEKLQEQNNK
ncbi:MAG: hypothetical protein ACK5MZ_03805 [Aestuariibaculum sp.]